MNEITLEIYNTSQIFTSDRVYNTLIINMDKIKESYLIGFNVDKEGVLNSFWLMRIKIRPIYKMPKSISIILFLYAYS